MERKTITIPAPILNALQRIADAKGIPLGELIRRALDEYVERAGGQK